jgi:hypothetical protein
MIDYGGQSNEPAFNRILTFDFTLDAISLALFPHASLNQR